VYSWGSRQEWSSKIIREDGSKRIDNSFDLDTFRQREKKEWTVWWLHGEGRGIYDGYYEILGRVISRGKYVVVPDQER